MADYDVKVLEISKGGNTYTYDAGGTHYAVCDTAAGTQTKAVTISEIASLTAGLSVCIKFSNAQTYNGQPKLQINSLTAANIVRMGTTAAARYEWNAGEVLDFVYDGTNFIIQEGAVPTTTYYGSRIKLSSATNSTSENLAATPKAVKAAYDLANGKASTSVASQSANGLMSSTDKTKLDGIATGATANIGTITGINMNGASKGTSGVVNLGTVLTSHQDISSKANRDEIGIVVTGKTASQNVTSGQYVIVRNSTISGISDGLYKASANVSAGTAFTSANLTVVSNGGLNSLNEQLTYKNIGGSTSINLASGNKSITLTESAYNYSLLMIDVRNGTGSSDRGTCVLPVPIGNVSPWAPMCINGILGGLRYEIKSATPTTLLIISSTLGGSTPSTLYFANIYGIH